MKKERQPPNPTAEESARKVADTFAEMSVNRGEELQKTQRLQVLNDRALALETERRAKKYGADDPWVLAQRARLEYNAAALDSLREETERAQTKTPPFTADAWRVQGRVYDANRQPLPNVAVFFADEGKQWIRSLGSTCTNAGGYYALTLQAVKRETPPLWLAVSDANQRLLVVDTEILRPLDGIVKNRDIYLSEADDCPTPPVSDDPGKTAPQELPKVKKPPGK